jgi:hypothetical protein
MRLADSKRWSYRGGVVGAVLLLAVGAGMLGSTAASAAPTVSLTYPVTGTTHLAAPDGDLALGPGTLHATVDLATGGLTGDLSLPPSTGSFTVLGLVPVTATTAFIPVGQTTGTVASVGGAITTTSRVILRITDLKIGGLPILIGPVCQSASPATITVTSQPGWNPAVGGTVAGTYTIPPFAHCLLQELLINLTIPGPDNTIALTLGRPSAG